MEYILNVAFTNIQENRELIVPPTMTLSKRVEKQKKGNLNKGKEYDCINEFYVYRTNVRSNLTQC